MRAQLKHCLIDVDFKDKPKVVDLQEIHGALARLLFIDCICLMSKSTTGGISRITIKSLARAIGVKESACIEILEYCLKEEMFYESNGLVFNSRVDKDQKKLQERRINALERQKRYEQKRTTNALDTRCPDPVPATVTDTEYNNKNSQPNIGLIKLSDYVRISEANQELFNLRLKTENLDEKAKLEIIELLDRHLHKNPDQQRETCHFRDLISWPLREIRQDRANLSKKNPFKPPEKSIREIIEERQLKEQINNLGK